MRIADANRDGRRRDAPICRAERCRQHALCDVDEMDGDEPRRTCAFSPKADPSQVPRLPKCQNAYAGLFCFVDADIDGLLTDDLSEAFVAIDKCEVIAVDEHTG